MSSSKCQLAKDAGQPVGQGSNQVPPGLACSQDGNGGGSWWWEREAAGRKMHKTGHWEGAVPTLPGPQAGIQWRGFEIRPQTPSLPQTGVI